MIQIGVTRHRDRQASHAQRAQRGHHHRRAEVAPFRKRRARVDEDRRAATLHQRRVTLADVQRHHARRQRIDRLRWRDREPRRDRERPRDAVPGSLRAHHEEQRTQRRDHERSRRSRRPGGRRDRGRHRERIQRDLRDRGHRAQRAVGHRSLRRDTGERRGGQRDRHQHEARPRHRGDVRDQPPRRSAADHRGGDRRGRGGRERTGVEQIE